MHAILLRFNVIYSKNFASLNKMNIYPSENLRANSVSLGNAQTFSECLHRDGMELNFVKISTSFVYYVTCIEQPTFSHISQLFFFLLFFCHSGFRPSRHILAFSSVHIPFFEAASKNSEPKCAAWPVFMPRTIESQHKSYCQPSASNLVFPLCMYKYVCLLILK